MAYLFTIISLVIIAVLLFFLLKQKKNQEEKLALYKANQEELKEKLNLKSRELIASSLSLTKKEQMLQSVAEQLDSVQNDLTEKGVDDNSLRNAIRELKPNSKTSGKAFEKQFIEINPTFYDRLDEKCSTLTPNERKLCAFLKLNMSTKEISEITQQSPRAIEVARHRLRKKLNLDRKDNLTSFISRIS